MTATTEARFEALYYITRNRVFTLEDVKKANLKEATFKKHYKDFYIKKVEGGYQF